MRLVCLIHKEENYTASEGAVRFEQRSAFTMMERCWWHKRVLEFDPKYVEALTF